MLETNNVTFEDLEHLTDTQIDALTDIFDAVFLQQTIQQSIGTIEKPWAIDASGEMLETYFQIEGTQLTQVVVTNEETKYSVVADPNILWWVKQASSCLAGVATLAAFASAKIATIAAKVYKILKAGKAMKLHAYAL